MSHLNKQFTTVDPREVDGNPFEVADIAVGQAVGLVAILGDALVAARKMARNSAMSRALEAGESLDAYEWEETAEARRWNAVTEAAEKVAKDLPVLRQAASFDPKHPPRT